MAIESDLASIKLHLGRIADALEGLLAEHGHVPTGPTTVDDRQQDLSFGSKPEDVADPDEKPVTKKKTKKKKGKKDIVVGKVEDDGDVVEWTVPLIRAELHKLQEQENQAAVKSMLKKFGASTLGQVDKSKYAQLAAAIVAELDE